MGNSRGEPHRRADFGAALVVPGQQTCMAEHSHSWEGAKSSVLSATFQKVPWRLTEATKMEVTGLRLWKEAGSDFRVRSEARMFFLVLHPHDFWKSGMSKSEVPKRLYCLSVFRRKNEV